MLYVELKKHKSIELESKLDINIKISSKLRNNNYEVVMRLHTAYKSTWITDGTAGEVPKLSAEIV